MLSCGERLLKIRIFTLAKELDMDSKVLIGVCQKVGIHLKDSPLASISEDEKERVLAFIRQGSSPGEAVPDSLAPKREPQRTAAAGKVPQIRPLAPRSAPLRELRKE